MCNLYKDLYLGTSTSPCFFKWLLEGRVHNSRISQTVTTNQKFDINILIQCLFSFSCEKKF